MCAFWTQSVRETDGWLPWLFEAFLILTVCEHPPDDRQHTQSSPTQKEQSERAGFNQRDLWPPESLFLSSSRSKGQFSHPHCYHSTPHNAPM